MANAPKPFSSEWLDQPSGPRLRRRRTQHTNQWLIRVFGRFPGERVLAVLAVVALVFSSFLIAGPGGEEESGMPMQLVGQVPNQPKIQFDDPKPTAAADINTQLLTVDDNAGGDSSDGAPVVPELNLKPAEPTEEVLTPGGLLPKHRIITFYGFPGNADMGVLGEYDPEPLLEMLKDQAAAYEAADPDHPVLLAMEVIASVAQAEPQADGSYLQDTPKELLDQYAKFTRDNGMLLILDAQIGYRTVENEIKGLAPWLRQEHVHLALDPEFAMHDGQVPGDHIGQIDATDIEFAQQWLVNLSATEGLTPRLLIVHQFTQGMIENKGKVSPMRGVQLIIDADGYGNPDLKISTYTFVNNTTAIEYAGIKLFYTQDKPIMEPEEVVNLDPAPLLVIYQ